MANIERIEGKTGVSFRITVAGGVDYTGKRIRHRTTWKPAPGMTERQMQKAVQRAAADFERSVEQGYSLDNRQTFAEYAEVVIATKVQNGALKPKTVERYRELLGRINPAIGHIQLVDIRAQHLNAFYKNLSEPAVREDGKSAVAAVDFVKLLKECKLSRSALSKAAGVSTTTINSICQGKRVSSETAESVAEALGLSAKDLFTFAKPDEGLSPKTILEHHRLISSVLAQAEREMLVPYNAAEKASPPKVRRKEPNYFQPDEMATILDALDTEPLKWRTITNLLIVTGCRRGEIMGLRWEKVDLNTGWIRIDSALLHSKERGTYESTTKTEDVRRLLLPKETIDLLRQHRIEQLRLQMVNGDRWCQTGYVFTQDNGEPMSPDSITGWLSEFSKRHDLPHINPHAFRHTVASTLLANGHDIVTVSKQLGHSNVVTTGSFYSHIIEENKAKATECIAETLLRRRA